MPHKSYRNNICAVIRRKSDNSVCIFHRKGFPNDTGWQFPQGGIDEQKELVTELKRELREEIGTDIVAVIAISPNTYYYDFPKNISIKHKEYCGQKQQWALVELETDEREICFKGNNAEFDAYQWVSPQEALNRIVSFKKDVYSKALRDLNLL